jgi:hypothetical protein
MYKLIMLQLRVSQSQIKNGKVIHDMNKTFCCEVPKNNNWLTAFYYAGLMETTKHRTAAVRMKNKLELKQKHDCCQSCAILYSRIYIAFLTTHINIKINVS